MIEPKKMDLVSDVKEPKNDNIENSVKHVFKKSEKIGKRLTKIC